MDEATVEKIHDFEASDLPEATKLALRFTERWVIDHGQDIDGELLLAMQRHYTDAEIVELALIVGRYDMAHRFNHAFNLERGEELYTFGKPRVSERMGRYLEELRAERRARESGEG